MTTQVEKLHTRLYGPNGMGVTRFHFTPGTRADVTAEERAKAINDSLDRIAAGDFEAARIDEDN